MSSPNNGTKMFYQNLEKIIILPSKRANRYI